MRAHGSSVAARCGDGFPAEQEKPRQKFKFTWRSEDRFRFVEGTNAYDHASLFDTGRLPAGLSACPKRCGFAATSFIADSIIADSFTARCFIAHCFTAQSRDIG